ncbi:MAG: ribosome maturation factor RimP [Desulfovibrionales bacterium]|nr:MAG: ribosome maturation factor RimP [Desulfovibrionales bacterium]
MWSTFFLDFQTAMQTSFPSSRPRSEEIRHHLEFLILPVVHGLGLELWGLEYLPVGRKALIRIYIDAEGGATIEQCAMVSRQLSPALEVDERLPGAFTLEVSSPGLERRFFKPEQLPPYIGRTVQVQLHEPMDGHKAYRGEVSAVDGTTVTLRESGMAVELDWNQIKKIHLIHTF